ncbi:MAG: tail protein X [Selenomonadaceae bacterium]|nr:tail protein X [Selenomonadaceae bacterium]
MTYTTCAGDQWDLISYKVYGTEKYVVELLRANPDYSDVFIFGANEEIKIPDIAPENKTSKLPPWKRK